VGTWPTELSDWYYFMALCQAVMKTPRNNPYPMSQYILVPARHRHRVARHDRVRSVDHLVAGEGVMVDELGLERGLRLHVDDVRVAGSEEEDEHHVRSP